MLKSCSKCGRIHERNYICHVSKVARIKPNTLANKFRNTQAWRDKRNSILIRDKGLCKVCIRNIYNTFGRIYNHKIIEVHHIEPIVEAYDLRLNEDNLISLCVYHHKMADRGDIPKKVLKDIIK